MLSDAPAAPNLSTAHITCYHDDFDMDNRRSHAQGNSYGNP